MLIRGYGLPSASRAIVWVESPPQRRDQVMRISPIPGSAAKYSDRTRARTASRSWYLPLGCRRPGPAVQELFEGAPPGDAGGRFAPHRETGPRPERAEDVVGRVAEQARRAQDRSPAPSPRKPPALPQPRRERERDILAFGGGLPAKVERSVFGTDRPCGRGGRSVAGGSFGFNDRAEQGRLQPAQHRVGIRRRGASARRGARRGWPRVPCASPPGEPERFPRRRPGGRASPLRPRTSTPETSRE